MKHLKNSYPEPTNTELKDREQSDSLPAENDKNSDKSSPDDDQRYRGELYTGWTVFTNCISLGYR